MDMITVLNTIPEVIPNQNTLTILICIMIAFIVIPIIISIIIQDPAPLPIMIFIILFFVLYSDANKYRPEKYECTINNGVDFKQFSDIFEVDGQRGDIYVVHLKADEK